MKITITKAEWDEMWAAIPDGWYMDDTVSDIPEAGEDSLRPRDVITIEGGFIVFDGREDEIREVKGLLSDKDIDGVSTIAVIQRWRKLQQTETLAVRCDKSQSAKVKAALKALGGKVL